MLLATLIDGVVLRDKQKVRASNYTQFHDQLEGELVSDGFVRAFFRGEPYVFAFSDGPISAPKKMVDYDPEYKDYQKRPVPFLPDPVATYFVDKGFEQRLPVYKRMLEDASLVINAATDDYEGELAFFSFLRAIGQTKTTMRVRPRAMTEPAVIECFNALEESRSRQPLEIACQLRERFEWLFTCNASNALCQTNFEKQLIPVGHMESMVLTMVAEQDKQARRMERHPQFDVVVELQPHKRAKSDRVSGALVGLTSLPESEAVKLTSIIAEHGVFTLLNEEFTRSQALIPLLDVYSLQVRANRELGLTPGETARLTNLLYERGLVTWPTKSHCLPWSLKTWYASAVTSLSVNPDFPRRIIPKDVDVFLGWTKEAPEYGHCGIIVTETFPDPDLAPEVKSLYSIVAEASIQAIKYREENTTRKLTFLCGGKEYVLFSSQMCIGPQESLPSPTPVKFDNGTEFDVKMCAPFERVPPGQYTQGEIVENCHAILNGAFCCSSTIFSSAIENLMTWGQVALKDNRLYITEKGKLAYKYISGTGLGCLSDLANWYGRLQMVADGEGDCEQYKEDMHAYVEDTCYELKCRAEEIAEMGGMVMEDLGCPVCGAAVAEVDDGSWSCTTDKKHFFVPASVHGHEMSKLDICELLTKPVTSLILDFSSAKGQTYAARLKMDKGRPVQVFQSFHRCPNCGGPLNEYLWGLKCNKVGCVFSMNTTICRHRLTEQELTTMLAGGSTEPLHLVNAKGKEFVAQLSLGPDRKVKFAFPNKRDKK